MPYVQAPTTLLAMVDASIGGKTGVNLAEAKNLVGSFYQPKMVLIDVELLRTLGKRELTEGWAEVIKHALIRDPVLLVEMESGMERLMGPGHSRRCPHGCCERCHQGGGGQRGRAGVWRAGHP